MAPDGYQQAPQRNMIRHTGSADRTQQNGIEGAESLQPVSGHHDAVFQIVVAAVREFFEFDFKTIAGGQSLQHPHTFGDNFPADAVSRNQGNLQGTI